MGSPRTRLLVSFAVNAAALGSGSSRTERPARLCLESHLPVAAGGGEDDLWGAMHRDEFTSEPWAVISKMLPSQQMAPLGRMIARS